jgi:uncharacterized repeat protein (TIGR02059 family)
MKGLLYISFLFICLASSATNYYIKNEGSDLSTGRSDSEAWATIARVNSSMNVFKPGDSILFKRGNSWPNSTILIGTAGVKGNNIVIGSYGAGSKPVIEGSENHSAILVNEANRGFWTIDNVDLRASGRINGVYNTLAIYHGYWTKDLGAIPGWIIQNCSFNCCIFLSGPGTIVRNSSFNGLGNPNNRGGAIIFRGPECVDCLAEFNTISNYTDRGIWIFEGGSNPVFRNNTISNIKKGADHGGSGINVDGYGTRVTSGKVYNNKISNVDMYAITFENGFNASVYNNRTENCGGVMIWQYSPYLGTGDMDIHHNVFHNGDVGIVLFNAKGINITNNTFVKNDDLGNEKIGLYITSSSTYVSNITFVNNIVAGRWLHLVKVPDMKDVWASFDYNIMFPSRPWIMSRGGRNLTLAQIQSLGYMIHGISSNPLFVNELSDFHLRSDSPAINTGLSEEYKSDIEGNPIDNMPDIGAFEYNGPQTVPLLLESSVENSSPAVLQINYNTPLSAIPPPASAFTVRLNSKEVMIDSVSINGTKVLIKLGQPVNSGDTVNISYTRPQTQPIRSYNGGVAADILTQNVTNNVLSNSTKPPSYLGSEVNDALPDVLEIDFDVLLAEIIPPLSAFKVTLNSHEIEINSAIVTSSKLLLTLSGQVMPGDVATVTYTAPAINPLQTKEGSLVKSFGPEAVTNNVITPPKSKFTVYPNPARDYITISGPENSFEKYIVRIMDLNGKVYMETSLKVPFSTQIIPISLKVGIYIIYILSGSSIVHSSKLIVD